MGLGPLSLFVAMLVVGGLGTFWGPMLGTALIIVVSEYLRDFEEARLIIVGLILLVTIVARAAWSRAAAAAGVEPAPAVDGRGRRPTREPDARAGEDGPGAE